MIVLQFGTIRRLRAENKALQDELAERSRHDAFPKGTPQLHATNDTALSARSDVPRDGALPPPGPDGIIPPIPTARLQEHLEANRRTKRA